MKTSPRLRLAIAIPALLALPACTTIQLGAANLIETAEVPRTEVTYGDGPRQRYDVYRALDSLGRPLTLPAPVVIFVHGGSWESGDKRGYAWVGEALAQQGFVAILPNYGLMPSTRFPDFVDDVARAVAHARARVTEWGGDTSRVVLMGHSAGAHIAALVAYDARYLAKQGATPAMFSGFVGLSGPYDFIFDTKLLRRTFAGPPEREFDALPVHFVTPRSLRTLLVMGNDDRTVNPRNTRSLAAALRKAAVPVEEIWVPGTHGVSVGAFARINRGESEIVRRIAAFVRASP
ncbi:MAG: alpha/beta hydrolase [Gemmatimonadota bacterium]|nr:alpha/beta hydrolase [Gemmatimonadota bacterium]